MSCASSGDWPLVLPDGPVSAPFSSPHKSGINMDKGHLQRYHSTFGKTLGWLHERLVSEHEACLLEMTHEMRLELAALRGEVLPDRVESCESQQGSHPLASETELLSPPSGDERALRQNTHSYTAPTLLTDDQNTHSHTAPTLLTDDISRRHGSVPSDDTSVVSSTVKRKLSDLILPKNWSLSSWGSGRPFQSAQRSSSSPQLRKFSSEWERFQMENILLQSSHRLNSQRSRSIEETIARAEKSWKRRNRSTSDEFFFNLAHDKVTQDLAIESLGGIFIVINTLTIGLSVEYDEWGGWRMVDVFFAVMFTIEMLLKMWVQRAQYLWGPDCLWNLFEAFLVGVAIVEVFITFDAMESTIDASHLSIVRMVKIVRISRLARWVRLPFFRDLFTMINGVVGGTRTLIWSMVLIMIPVYAVALLCRETIGRERDTPFETNPFDTIYRSIFTLFRCMVPGECSDELGRPIFVLLSDSHGWVWAVVFCVTNFCMAFGLGNVITGIYVENTMAASKNNDMLLRKQRLQDRERLARKLTELLILLYGLHPDSGVPQDAQQSLHHLDVHFDAVKARQMRITSSLWEQLIADNRVDRLLDDLDVSAEDRESLFDLLNASGGGELQLEDLLVGIVQVRGDPHKSDIVSHGLVLRSVQGTVQELSVQIDKQAETLRVINSKCSRTTPQRISHGIQPFSTRLEPDMVRENFADSGNEKRAHSLDSFGMSAAIEFPDVPSMFWPTLHS